MSRYALPLMKLDGCLCASGVKTRDAPFQILLKGWELVNKWITMRVSNQFDAPFYIILGVGTFNTNKSRFFA